jgi:thymidylate kinase
MLKTLDAAVQTLKLARMMDATLQHNPKIDDFFLQLETVERDCFRFARQGFGHVKVLVIEGLSGSGKSTLANRLKVITRGTALTEVPIELVGVRHLFSSAGVPEAVIAALEHTFHYIIAHRLIHQSATQPADHLVILEQLYHATCAQAVCANVTSDIELSTLPRSAFEWPIDLPVPHLVMFLTLSTAVRMQRQKVVGRGSSLTERSNERNIARDARAQTAYSLVRGPTTIALDASVGPDDVLDAAIEACEEFGLYQAPPVGSGGKRVSMGLYGAFTKS